MANTSYEIRHKSANEEKDWEDIEPKVLNIDSQLVSFFCSNLICYLGSGELRLNEVGFSSGTYFPFDAYWSEIGSV